MIMKNVAIMLTSEPQHGGEHQYLMLLFDSIKFCDGKYFNVLAICYNKYWKDVCKKYGISYIQMRGTSYTQKEMELQIKYPYLNLYSNMRNDLLGKVIREKKISLLICGQQGIFLPKYRCKTIHPVHDLMHRYEPSFKEISSTYKSRDTVFRGVARLSDVVLVDSKLGKKQFIESYYNGRHFPKIEILPFVAPQYVNKNKEEYINTPAKYIFYPAQFWEHKNHLNLIKAVKIVKKVESDIQLVLVGSEKNSLKRIKELIKEEKLEKNVSILGYVSNEQIVYLYKHAVALVMPTYFGPTNIPPLEAMVLGCPVIVSDKYAMGEQVGDAGLLFDPDSPEEMAECIIKVWNNDDLRQKMIMRGYKRVKKWTERDFKRKFIKIVLSNL